MPTPDEARAAVAAALNAIDDADQAATAAREQLEDALALAATAGVPQTELIQLTGRSREHVRRLTRAGQDRSNDTNQDR